MNFVLAVIIVAVIIVVIAVSVVPRSSDSTGVTAEPEYRRAGRYGERLATNLIREVLNEDDRLFTNVNIECDGMSAELDNVIVNSYGVFIIETKNYKGRLYGNEDDYKWIKFKDDGYGNTFEKEVKNPIKQVKRQTYILAKYLKQNGQRVWIDGYAFLVNGNSPVESCRMLSNSEDIDRAIHTIGKKPLTKQQADSVAKLLQ